MKILKIINPENISEKESSDFRTRIAARAIVIDFENKIALLKANKFNYYKIPGGGVEEGEDIKIGLEREVEEEAGCDIEIVDEIGEIVEYRGKHNLIQKSYVFVAKVLGDKRTVNFTDKEIEEEFELIWVSLDEAIKLMKQDANPDYDGKFMLEREITILKVMI